MKRRSSIAIPLLLHQAFVFVVAAGVAGAILYRSGVRGATAEARSDAENLAIALEELLREDPQAFKASVLLPIVVRSAARIVDVERIVVVDRAARVIALSQPGPLAHDGLRADLLRALTSGAEVDAEAQSEAGQAVYRVGRAIRGPYDERARTSIAGAIAVETNLSAKIGRVHRAFAWTMGTLMVLLLGLGALQWMALRARVVRRLRDVVGALEAFGAGDETHRAPTRGADEIALLGTAFNAMADRIGTSAESLRSANGRLQAELAERLQAERSLRASEDRHRAVMQSASEGILYAKDTGEIVSCNAAGERLFGRGAGALGGRRLDDLVVEADGAVVREAFARVARGEGETIELTGRRHDGTAVPIEVSLAAWRVDGECFVTGIVRDVSHRKEVEQALREAREAALTTARLKSEFLANMSHEIRTPMNGVIGMTELLLATEPTDQQRRYLAAIKTSGEALLHVINDILDFSKIEAGKLTLEAAEFDVAATFADAVRAVAPAAHHKGLELTCRVGPDVPASLVGDPWRLRQVVVNLAGNAVKFTERGEVVVDVAVEGVAEGRATLHVTVTDTGIGIPPERQQAIFDAFTQVDGSTTRKYGGTGLGLTISRAIVAAMSGQFWLESEVGVGSRFHFRVELPLTGSRRREAGPPPMLADLEVLVVDDNETNRLVLEGTLRRWRMRPTVVENAVRALEILKNATAEGRAFPLILVDAMMPEMDGFELSAEITARQELAGATILMLSSAGPGGNVERCREVGVSAYLHKPIKSSELLDAIVAALAVKAVPAAPPPADADAPLRSPRPRRILLAEDNAINQDLAVALLEMWGHTVVVVDDGRQAVEATARETFDLVLMDVQMPTMSGIEATAAIRERERATGGHVPIVAMTARAMKGDHDECLAAGMDGYVGKPFDRRQLFDVIEATAGTAAADDAVSAVA